MSLSHKYRLPYLFVLFSLFFLYRYIHLGGRETVSSSASIAFETQGIPPVESVPSSSSLEPHDHKLACRTNSVERNTDRNHNNAHMDFWLNLPKDTLQQYQAQWQSFIRREMKKLRSPPRGFQGRGIVLVAGNGDTFHRALTALKLLRHYGCGLPAEVWHLNDEQPDKNMVAALHDVQALPRDLSDKHLIRPIDQRRNADKQFQIKAAAIINAGFEHVLYLDSDNIPTTDPTFLFDHPAYQETGALFWPDFWKTHGENGIFDVLDIDCQDEWEQESGQMVIDKVRSWYPLQLAWFMNHHHEIYYQFLNGDKDTFRFAWKALKHPYYMNPTFLGMAGTLTNGQFCGHTMLQYPPEDDRKPLFVHANLLKITDKIHFLHQDGSGNSGQNVIERPWEWIKQYTQGTGATWLLPEFYISGFSRACMDFEADQGEPMTNLTPFDTVVPRLQELYFEFGGIGGETR